MPDPGASILKFPPVYRIAYSDGEQCGLVEDFKTREFWQAESALHDLQAKYPELLLWVTWRPAT